MLRSIRGFHYIITVAIFSLYIHVNVHVDHQLWTDHHGYHTLQSFAG